MVWSKTSVHCNLGNTDKAKVWVIYAAERSSSHTSAHYNSTLTVWPQWADLQCVTLWLLGRGEKRRFPGHAPDSRCFGQPWRLMALSLKTSVWSLGGSSHDKWWSTTRRSPQTEPAVFLLHGTNCKCTPESGHKRLFTTDTWCMCMTMLFMLPYAQVTLT